MICAFVYLTKSNGCLLNTARFNESVLVGDYMSSAHYLRDEHGKKGIFFLFPNLAVRKADVYKLKFSLIPIHLYKLLLKIGLAESLKLQRLFFQSNFVFIPRTHSLECRNHQH